jgi:hypothetical protein
METVVSLSSCAGMGNGDLRGVAALLCLRRAKVGVQWAPRGERAMKA